MAGDDIPPGPIRRRMLTCERASRVLSRAESDLKRAHLPEPARRRVDQAFELLQTVCAAFGGPDGKGGE